MEQIWLSYGTRTTVEDCEDVWVDATGGKITPTADNSAGNVMMGTYSAKFAVGDTVIASTLCAYENFASADFTAFTHVSFWFKCSKALAAGNLKLLLDNTNNCVSPVETLDFPAAVANEWTHAMLAFVTPSNLSAVLSVGFQTGAAFTLTDGNNVWIDDVVVTNAKQFDVLSVRGLDRAEDVQFWVPISEQLLDGTIAETISGYRRRITVDFEAITSLTNLNWLLTWLQSGTKYISGDHDDVRVVLEDPSTYGVEWLSGFSEARKPTITCLERSIRTTVPVSFGYA